ncbi:MAG: hypothetical protein K0S76_2417 [Herbinix sp.]|jgi:hypothetical protein|nr:hypothetical protein [Herbinix sp.]
MKIKKSITILLTAILMIVILVSGIAIYTNLIASNEEDELVSNAGNEKTILYATGDFPYYESIDELYNKADLVIEGKVIDVRAELLNDRIGVSDPEDKELYTIYTIDVKKTYKGNIQKNDTLEVKVYGGDTNTMKLIYSEAVYLDVNEKYILFLNTYENSPACMLNNIQAHYKIDDTKLIKEIDNNFELDFEKLEKLKTMNDKK